MSLSSILTIGGSGLQAAQTGLRTVSDNVSNVGTAGYIRKIADQSSVSAGGVGVGVSTDQLKLATDRFLAAAGLKAQADSGAATARSGLLDQAQSLFGDPNASTSFFNGLDAVFTAFTALAATPGATSNADAVAKVSSFLDDAGTISASLTDLQTQADGRIAADIDTVNGLLKKIDALNTEISRTSVGGGDSTGSQERQSQLIDQLSTLIDVRSSPRAQGGVTLRTADGVALAGDGAASLSYSQSTAGGRLIVTTSAGTQFPVAPGSGEIGGLLQARNQDIPAVSAQLAELTHGVVDQLNAIHNAHASVPAPATLTGRDTGLPIATAVSGFTGKTTIGIVDASGALQAKAAVDFDAGTITVGATTTSFTPATFVSTLNTALSGYGGASVSGGRLTLSATGGNGVVIADDATTPATKAGQGFSDFFGLNDLVTSTASVDYATGLTPSDANPFSGTGSITFSVTGADGSLLRNQPVSIPSGGQVSDVLAALNDPASGLGLYGTFALDAQGRLGFTPAAGSGVTLGVTGDTTQSATSPGVSVSTLFGLNPAQRALTPQTYAVRSDIASDPNRLALAAPDLTVAVSASAVSPGDVRGGDALSQAGNAVRRFDAAGGIGSTSVSVSAYASRIAAAIASRSGDADASATQASAVATEAQSRRSSAEGVNLDQELIALTSYQQSYNASARLIQAAKDIYDALLQIV
jgi:flagellar hook-associated protein 1 FlgK